MSSNFIKLQMKLEDMSEEHKLELASVKETSFEEGIEAGIQKAAECYGCQCRATGQCIE